MPAQTGINSLDDLRDRRQAGSAVEIGLDTINEVLQADLAYTNQQVNESLAVLSEDTTDKMRVYGTQGQIDPLEIDEFGVAPTRKAPVGGEVAFPLRMYKSAVGWTTMFLRRASAAEIAERYIMVRKGHILGIQRDLTRSLFNDGNYTFRDTLDLGREVQLTVRRAVNADGQPIPDSPAGVKFDPNVHTHYKGKGAGALAAADIDGLIENVTEHGHTRGIKLYINSGQAATISGFSPGFLGLRDAGIIYNATDVTQIAGDFSDMEDYLLGFWRRTGIEIHVKPWIPAGYIMAFAAEGTEKVLCRRLSPLASEQGLLLIPEVPTYPLRADNFEALYGFGVWNRTAAAFLDITNDNWVDPVIPSVNDLQNA